MNVLIITKDEILSRMLFLEISAFGASVREARALSEEIKNEIPLCDFTVLDAELFAAEEDEDDCQNKKYLPGTPGHIVLLFSEQLSAV